MINCPYSKMELLLTAMTSQDKLTEENLDKLNKEFSIFEGIKPENKMKEVAKFIGVSIETLINSPNLNDLIIKYESHMFSKTLSILKSDSIGFTDKEAWLILLMAIDPSFFEKDFTPSDLF